MMKLFLRLSVSVLLVTGALATYGYGGGGGYSSGYSDCGGGCDGGCGGGNPCGGSSSGQYYSVPSEVVVSGGGGCGGDECGGGGSRRVHSSRQSSGGYHKSSTTVTKETQSSSLRVVVGAPQVTRTTYVQPAAPVVVHQPVVYHKKQRYVESVPPAPVAHRKHYSNYESSGDGGCEGPCGGSRIVKVIRNTYTDAGSGECNTCAADSYTSGGGHETESYVQPAPQVVHKKITRIIHQPVVTRVIKTVVAQPQTSEYYSEDSSGGCGGGNCGGGGHGGYRKKYRSAPSHGGYGGGGGQAKAYAFASASAGAGASSGGYNEGGGGGGCKTGCDEWKK